MLKFNQREHTLYFILKFTEMGHFLQFKLFPFTQDMWKFESGFYFMATVALIICCCVLDLTNKHRFTKIQGSCKLPIYLTSSLLYMFKNYHHSNCYSARKKQVACKQFLDNSVICCFKIKLKTFFLGLILTWNKLKIEINIEI